MEIREASEEDWSEIWPIFHAVVETGDTYAYSPNTTKDQAHRLWMAALPNRVYIAILNDLIIGTYFLRPAQPGLGSHVANAGFMIKPGNQGRGIGRLLGEHALTEAKRHGFEAMQFNFVVSTNERAVKLWQSLGFSIIGTVPDAFRHRTLGPVAIHIMHRAL